MTAPRAFISYSWSGPDHEARVLELATELRESGVDVVLDKWDLRDGHDAFAFMEKMVTDDGISKVVLVCDREYVRKTNERSGGVGTEAQIISSEIYEQQEQDKFVAVIFEREENGKPCVPAFYKSRIFIDMSDAGAYAENFERLVRWAFDKPLEEKPPLGTVPAYVASGERALQLGTAPQLRRALDAVKTGKEYAPAAVEEYFLSIVQALETLRLETGSGPFDEAVVQSIDEFLPYRDELIEVFLSVAAYRDTEETRRSMARFFEKLLPYMDPPMGVSQWSDWDFDNYVFIVHELFLYALAAYIKYERFEAANYLLQAGYFVPGNADRGRETMLDFTAFRRHMRSLEARKARLKLNRLSIRADLLKDRCKGVGIAFSELLQADFVAYVRAALEHDGPWAGWWPESLVWLASRFQNSPLEVFARSRSQKYFEQSKVLLGIETKADLDSFLESAASDERRVPRWDFDTFDSRALLGFDSLCTRP